MVGRLYPGFNENEVAETRRSIYISERWWLPFTCVKKIPQLSLRLERKTASEASDTGAGNHKHRKLTALELMVSVTANRIGPKQPKFIGLDNSCACSRKIDLSSWQIWRIHGGCASA